MHTHSECLPCFITQALETARLGGADPEIEQTLLRQIMSNLSTIDFSVTPPEIAVDIHQMIMQMTNNHDIYAQIKKTCNQKAMELYPYLKEKVNSSSAPLETAGRMSIAGNIIDFGVSGAHRNMSMATAVEEALSVPLAVNDLPKLTGLLEDAKRVLYICDNAGEIVFDRVFIETIGPERVTCAVKSRPILNDAMRFDAEFVGLSSVVPVIESGMGLPGTVLEQTTPEFQRYYEEANVVIAKGQGNFETMNRLHKDGLFFLLRAKCPVVARVVGSEIGGLIVKAALPSQRRVQTPA